MRDRVLVDGHNALHALGLAGRGDHESDRDALLLRVADRQPDALVYFDGRNAPRGLPRVLRQKGVKVHYCTRGEADRGALLRPLRTMPVPPPTAPSGTGRPRASAIASRTCARRTTRGG